MTIQQNIECPNCKKTIILLQTIQEIPHFGKLLLSTVCCNNCGFKFSDVFSLDFKKPIQYSAKISNEEDLKIKIVKSSTAIVKIPELGVSIQPASASEGYFSNIEGLLDRIQQVAEILVKTAKEPKEVKAVEKTLEKIKKARNNEFNFTVIIQDVFGNSALIGKNVEKKELSEKEIRKLKILQKNFKF